MKHIIRFLIRKVPRPVLIRFSKTFSLFIRLWYTGNEVECPVCNGQFRKFLPYGVNSRDNVLCPKCLSLERHRLIWLYLTKETDFLTTSTHFLHVAPEQCFYPRFKKNPYLQYVTADLESPIADLHFDLHDIPLNDNTFDLVMCNHVLEHVDDDARVLKELYRVVKPGGLAILQVPLDPDLTETYENPDIVDPDDREIHFRQKDHVRLYGKDYPARLAKAGFSVTEFLISDHLEPEQVSRYRIDREEVLYLARKPKL